VAVGTTVSVCPGGTTLWVTADGFDGVASVELWYAEQKDCGEPSPGPDWSMPPRSAP